MSEKFSKVILPLSLHDAFTYKVPEKFTDKVFPGKRVVVQFGAKKYYAALVVDVISEKPENIDLKEVIDVLDEKPVVLPQNFELWHWIAKYYCCTLGDVFRAALPSGLKLESKSRIGKTSDEKEVELSNAEEIILRNINDDFIFLADLQKKTGNEFSYPALKTLLNKNIIFIEEKVSDKYKPKTETYVKFHPTIKNEKVLQSALENLKRAKQQEALVYHFCYKTNAFEKQQNPGISRKELFEGTHFNSGILKALEKKKVLSSFQVQISRIEEEKIEQTSINLLNQFQEKALEEIKHSFQDKQVTLIHGITASGKTEIYIHLIDEVLKLNKQALYLVPEIALTTQIILRLKNVFGNKVGIYHSKLNSLERVEIWEKVLRFKTNPQEGYQVILGARSALFMPFSNLGIIIVDEEHENSFKQYDPAPRYNARDMAVVLGMQHKAKVLLGSATPSYESYYNALTGKYGLVNLFKRHANIELPEIIVSDVKRAYKKKQMHSILSPELFDLMNKALEQKEQIILFQNRRGYSPFVECFTCGYIPKCINCDVSLTYHKFKKRLNCHYCGFSQPYPNKCDECASPEIKTRGFGTEKIEDELKPLFRNARFDRMDMDTTRSKNAFEKIITKLENKKTDILIGTQMVTKGLDFDHVSVVGILNADNLINFPDFRAHERAYQLISQVSGRAGRKHKQGKVVIQTSQPEHPLVKIIQQQDYNSAFYTHLQERKLFNYPPYSRLIKLQVKHKNIDTVDRVANRIGVKLRENKYLIVLGPEFPLINRIQLWYIKEIWLKIDRKWPMDDLKTFIKKTIKHIKQQNDNSNCVINIDVDPN